MSNKYFVALILSIQIAVCSLVVMFFYVNMANDLSNKVTKLEQENQQLKWELSQVDQMICANGDINNE